MSYFNSQGGEVAERSEYKLQGPEFKSRARLSASRASGHGVGEYELDIDIQKDGYN